MNATSFKCVTGLVLAVSLWILPTAGMAQPVTWPFDLQTSGQDVLWTSPTAIDPAAARYDVSWEITLLEVTVKYSVLPSFVVDVTDQIPPEYREGEESAAGPAPVVALSDRLVYPEPPEPAALAADIEIGLDAQGYGYASATDVELGEMEVNVPPFGVVVVDIEAIHVVGTVTAEALGYIPGDLNCDGNVDFGDINPFVLALTNPAGYAATYPDCDIITGDVNLDGKVDFGDINPFVSLLAGGY